MDSRINVDQRLAESFKQLLIKNPIEKITIKDITDGAGVIRPTFYNHFQDKYDLLEWIVKHELLGPFFPQLKRGHLEDGLILIFTNALQMKEFCIRAAKMEGQNSFESIVRKCIWEMLLTYIRTRCENRNFSHSWMTPEIVAEYYAQSLTFVVMTWIRKDMIISSEEMATVYQYIIHRSMDEMLNEML
ncbi:TetR family transcriptional regulator [bacterium 0.1xD8-71]|nr:TetR family transcriptional regulator [bacterium 0.1xD8-71]